MVSIRFNTRLECPKSYITVEKEQSSIRKIYCGTKKIHFDNYSSFSHECSVDFLERGNNFEYMAYGWTGNASEPEIPFKGSNMKSHLISRNQDVKMVVLADWGYLQTKAKVYDKLDDAFDYILGMKEQPDVVYLGGDYAYDLSTGNGASYEYFLIMLSQISSVWPCIFMTGNHEYNTPEDFMLFNKSFELYNLTN